MSPWELESINPGLLLLKWGLGGKGVWESNGTGWMDQVKDTHSGGGDTPLNINLNINNENQDCKIGTVHEGETGGRQGEWMKEIKVNSTW
jgi:hypothetical protein